MKIVPKKNYTNPVDDKEKNERTRQTQCTGIVHSGIHDNAINR